MVTMFSMKTTLPSFVILRSGHAVILDAGGRKVDVLPRRLTRPLLALIASASSPGEGYKIADADEEQR